MSNSSQQDSHQQTAFSLGDSPARTSALPADVLAWLEREAGSSTKSRASSKSSSRSGSSSKTSPVFFPLNEGQTWEQLSERWSNSGMASPGGCWMLSTSEYPSGGAESSSLADVLETSEVPQKYYLSAKACAGILTRAARRGKKLPEALETALRAQAGDLYPPTE